jgi:hypothetical protein
MVFGESNFQVIFRGGNYWQGLELLCNDFDHILEKKGILFKGRY